MVKETTSNIDFYLTILNLMKTGKNPTTELNISKQKLYYYRRQLKELGFLKKENRIWKVISSKKEDLEHALNWKDKKIRGHAFIWKVKSNRDYDWKMLLERKDIKYNLVRGLIPRIFVKDKKVWLGKNSITIYETKSFYGKNAIESRKYAVFELQETIRELKRKLGIDFKYFFKPVREHFGMIKNELARQCNENGDKIIVRDTLDGEWLWIDDSTGMMGELETGGKGFTKDRAAQNMEVQNWYNDMKRTNFKVTPTFLMESINGVTQNQIMFDKNYQSHLKVIKKLGNAVDELRKEIKSLTTK
jgi:hypothetical protein